VRPRFLVALLVLLAAAPAGGQVACSGPDALCTGDPCVVPSLTVADPCAVDFGTRTVVVAGTLRLPANGTLELRAGTLVVRGIVRNDPDSRAAGGTGPQVSLDAVGDLELSGGIRLNGRRLGGTAVPGMLVVRAGGRLLVDGAIRTSTGPTALMLAAGGDAVLAGAVVGTPGTASTLAVDAGGRADVGPRLRHLAVVTIAAGSDADLHASVTAVPAVAVAAGGVLTSRTTFRVPGSTVALRGAGGVHVTRPLGLLPLLRPGGVAEMASAAGPVTIDMPVRAGAVQVTAAGDVAVNALVAASPPKVSGGSVAIASTGGDVHVAAELTAQSGDGTGPGEGAGGDVHVTAAGAVLVDDDIRVNAFLGTDGAPGGTVRVEAGSVRIGPGVVVDAGGDDPGPGFAFRPPPAIRLRATAGDLALDGRVTAAGGPSVVEGYASGDLAVRGRVTAACIALGADGTTDLADAVLEGPLLADCPGD
jgi:hypothetical protein